MRRRASSSSRLPISSGQSVVFTDSHAHLPSLAETEGAGRLAEVCATYAEAWAEGGWQCLPAARLPLLVDIGTEADDFPKRFRLLGDRPFLRYTLGVWPARAALADVPASLAALALALEAAGPRAAAVGECGLDYHHMEAEPATQRRLFEGQAALAAERGLPLVVHSRDAFADTRDLLAAARHPHAVIIHCFGYGPTEAEAFLDLGCIISFAGNFTYKNADALRAALRIVPSARLLLETDTPYMNPEPRRGRPSSPLDIVRSYEAAALLRQSSAEALATSVAELAHAVFG